MRAQKVTSNRVIRDTLDWSYPQHREHLADTGPIHVWTKGSVRVSMSRYAIICEAGFSHELLVIGKGNTMHDEQPLVRLAAIQQARLVVGLPLLPVAEEDAFLAKCKPAGRRPLSRLMIARAAARKEAKGRPSVGHGRAA